MCAVGFCAECAQWASAQNVRNGLLRMMCAIGFCAECAQWASAQEAARTNKLLWCGADPREPRDGSVLCNNTRGAAGGGCEGGPRVDGGNALYLADAWHHTASTYSVSPVHLLLICCGPLWRAETATSADLIIISINIICHFKQTPEDGGCFLAHRNSSS
ncbi:unnamed protein product [Pleuronectes platessa]|uniref:Uncharacterized protein n=1 Tax=Pleuronectes platessa TaxID=8262 RepID=A0A9N7Y8P0_PLEPL|nr:unnamed protein product [Pleuronectes platessa]